MKTNPNELIQPVIYSEQNGYSGLTKREYFAALALQGMLAERTTATWKRDEVDARADDAVVWADALVKSLNKDLTEAEKPE